MSRIFLIGDLHFGDSDIIKLENRPFKDVIHQTECLAEYWNSVVEKDDIVYVLGDFIAPNCPNIQYHLSKISKLNGIKYLIKGNHDTESDQFYLSDCGFKKVYDFPIIVDDFWIFSHIPMYINEHFPYANVFAHVHNNPIYTTHSCRSYCVSSERISFKPILFNTIKQTIKKDNQNKS